MKTCAERIREGLALRGMRQSELCQKTGINKSLMSHYTNGRYSPKSNNIYKIAKALDVSEAWLIGYDVPTDRAVEHAIERMEAIELTDKEKRLIEAYRLKTEMQGAVDTLLGIE